jgi:hypothetical protein
MEAVNAVDNPTTKKWKTRQDTIDQEDIITNGQRTMKYHTSVNNHTWSVSTHQQSASGRQNRGRGWGTSSEHMEINSKNPQENIVDVQLENSQRTNGYFKGNNT